MSRINELRDRKAVLLAEADALSAKDAAGTISAEETARLDAILAKGGGDLDKINASIAREERLMEERRSAPAVIPAATVPAEPKADGDEPKFASFGEQLQKVARAGMNKGMHYGAIDSRLKFEAASGSNEAVPSEGGFLVQQDFSTAFLDMMHEQGEIMSRVRRIPISTGANGIKLPAIDETSRVSGSRFGGVQAYWADESDTVTATKPKFRSIELKLNKLMGIGYATEELLADSAALESVMSTAFVEELTFKTEDAIINGSGSGQPLGILNSGAVVTQAKENAQSADTVVTNNILKMWARTPIRSRRNLVWMVNQDVEPQLWGLVLGSGTGVVLLYTPPGANGNNSPYGLLLGRPVIPVEQAATIGDVGDLILFDPQSYVMIDKNGIAQATSMHVRFIYDEMTFRFTFRVDGQPVWRTAVTPFKGTNTISPYVVLEAR